MSRRIKLVSLRGEDVNELAEPASVAKLDDSGDGGEQRIIFAEPDILARLVPRAALPDNN